MILREYYVVEKDSLNESLCRYVSGPYGDYYDAYDEMRDSSNYNLFIVQSEKVVEET